jgi:hypothetical protein
MSKRAVMLLVLLSLAACGSDTSGIADGGAEAMDSGAPVDAFRAPECEGIPTACATLDVAGCASVDGCSVSRCAGAAVICSEYTAQSTCDATAGCRWSGSSCGGSATSCERIEGESACSAQQGCRWEAVESCQGRATRCESLSRTECTTQPGCRLAGIDSGMLPEQPDAGPPDAPAPDTGAGEGGALCVAPEGPWPTPGCNEVTGIECDGDWRGIDALTGSEYCSPACAESDCCVPRGGRFECTAPDAATGRCPAPDLFVDGDRIAASYVIRDVTVADDSCSLIEGCVAASGARRLLRFDTWTPNIGTADMFLGVPSVDSPHFEYSECHDHYHFTTYAEYELVDADGECVAATGHKQAFCLMDVHPYPDTAAAGRPRYVCEYQGIQMGWQDVYDRDLPCQWVDITDVPAGEYQLRVRVNVEHVLNETDYENNEVVVPVTIP